MNGLLIGFLPLISLSPNASYANCDKTFYEIAQDSFEKATDVLSPSELVFFLHPPDTQDQGRGYLKK